MSSVAVDLFKLGYTSLVSVEGGGKRPALWNETYRGWKGYSWNGSVDLAFAEKIDRDGRANIGLRSRRFPGLDIDSGSIQLTIIAVNAATEILGQGPARFSVEPRRLLVYRTDVPFKKRKLSITLKDGSKHAVELLGDGQQYVIHGRHPSGSRYRFEGSKLPKNPLDLPLITEELVSQYFQELEEFLIGLGAVCSLSASRVGPAPAMGDEIHDGARSDTLTSAAGGMRQKNFPEAAILSALLEINNARCAPPLDEEEVKGIARSVMRYEPGDDLKVTRPQDVFKVVGDLASRAPPPPPRDFETYRGGEFMGLVLPEEKYLIDGLIPRMDSSLIVAKPKIGKSILGRDLALAIALERQFLGRETVHGNVVYVMFLGEGSKAELQEELGFLGLKDHPLADNFLLLMHPPWDMTKPEIIESIGRHALEHQPVLIVVDTLQGIARVEDISNYSETYAALAPLRTVQAETGAHLMLIHHEPKGAKDEYADPIEAALGSTAIGGSVDVALRIYRDPETGTRYLAARGRRSIDMPPHELKLDPDTHRLELGAEAKVIKTRAHQADVLAMFDGVDGYLTGPDIRGEVTGKNKDINAAIKSLVAMGAVRQEGNGRATKYWLVHEHKVFDPQEVDSADGSADDQE